MPFGVVSAVSRGMGVLNGGGDRRREGAVLGINVGHPIVTSGTLWRFFSALGGGDVAFPKLLWDFLFYICGRLLL